MYNDWGGEVLEGEEVVAGLRLEARMLGVVCVIRVGGRGGYIGVTVVENEANNEKYFQSIEQTMTEARKAMTTSAWVVGTGPNLLAESLGTPEDVRTPSLNPVDHRGLHESHFCQSREMRVTVIEAIVGLLGTANSHFERLR